MSTNPLPPRPKWFDFAVETSRSIDHRHQAKSFRRQEDSLYRAWLKACSDYGYQGSSKEWEYLVLNYEKSNLGRRK